jgi:hypothetical protein
MHNTLVLVQVPMAVRCATTKNRYRNIQPKWDTRVQLATRNACGVDAPEEEHLLGGRDPNGAALATDTGAANTDQRCSSALSTTSTSGGDVCLAAAAATVAERELDLGRDHQLLATYINANYITMKGHTSPSYIAAQARLAKLPPFFFNLLAHLLSFHWLRTCGCRLVFLYRLRHLVATAPLVVNRFLLHGARVVAMGTRGVPQSTTCIQTNTRTAGSQPPTVESC